MVFEILKTEKDKVMPSNLKTKEGIIKPLKQRGKIKSIAQDMSRTARAPGKRISKTGKIYWETRRNRSDAPDSKI